MYKNIFLKKKEIVFLRKSSTVESSPAGRCSVNCATFFHLKYHTVSERPDSYDQFMLPVMSYDINTRSLAMRFIRWLKVTKNN